MIVWTTVISSNYATYFKLILCPKKYRNSSGLMIVLVILMYKALLCIYQQSSGGGGGGRISIVAQYELKYGGTYGVRGGYSGMEVGGSGTAYVLNYLNKNQTDEQLVRSLYVDNENNRPLTDYATMGADHSRTYIVANSELNIDKYEFDHIYLTRGGHLAFKSETGSQVEVEIGEIHGDYSGYFHVMTDMLVHANRSASPFPASFGVYKGGIYKAPTCKSFNFTS